VRDIARSDAVAALVSERAAGSLVQPDAELVCQHLSPGLGSHAHSQPLPAKDLWQDCWGCADCDAGTENELANSVMTARTKTAVTSFSIIFVFDCAGAFGWAGSQSRSP
jgi:hypothetical protein